ncbi:MAG: fibronectin type III domain-containing protein [Miltoncostaeaceae bacterium]
MAFDDAGSALVAWVERAATPDLSIWGRRLDAASGAWSDPAEISSPLSGNSARYPVVALAPRGSGLVAWNEPPVAADLLASTYTPPDVAPWPPGRPTATAGDARVEVSWAAPGFDGGQPITSYIVTAAPGGATCTAQPPATSCTVTGLTNGTAYTFTVVAVNSIGTSRKSPASSPVTPASAPAPAAPTAAPVTPAEVPTMRIVTRTAVAVGNRSVALTTRVRVNGPGRIVQTGRSGATAGAQGDVLCGVRRVAAAAGTYRLICSLGARSRASLETRSLRVRLTTTFVAADGQRVTRTTSVWIKRMPQPRTPVTG